MYLYLKKNKYFKFTSSSMKFAQYNFSIWIGIEISFVLLLIESPGNN